MSLGFIRELTPVQPEILFTLFGFKIANSTMMLFLMLLFFAAIGFSGVRKFKQVPNTFQSLVELIYESILGLVEQIVGDRKHAEKLLPIIGSILIFFVVSNIIAMIPGLTSIQYNGTALLRAPTTDINSIIGVSLAVVVALNIVSYKEHGFWGFLGIYFPIKNVFHGFKKSILDGFIALIQVFVGVLGIVGEAAKATSLTFRLFGNMFAGTALSTIIIGSFAFILPAAWGLMNGFTSILQGIVYAILVTVYYTLSLNGEKES